MNSSKKWLAIVFAVCAISSFTTAQGFPLKKIPSLTYLVDYEASRSPDGKTIVLISNRHGGQKVHVLNASGGGDGSSMKQITSGPDEDDSPVWAPDGQKIAFVSIRDGFSHIVVMNADGSDIRQLTNGVGQNIHPAWSPDGAWALFNTTHFTAQLTDAVGEFVNPRWSPDGRKILCGRRMGGVNLVVFQAPD
jgi:Tol biopolymer transport system component